MPVVRRQKQVRTARTHRVKEIADKVLDNTSSIAQQEINNAFLVNPHPITLYIPLTNGYPCSCTYNDTLASDGSMKPELMDSLLSSPVTITPSDSIHAKHDMLIGTTSSVRPRTGDDKRTPVTLTDDAEITDLGEISGTIPTPDMNPFGFSGTSCPVCFGTSFIGGYNVFRGSRIVLSPSRLKDAEGISIDHTAAPNKIMSERNGAFVLFDVVFPKNAISVTAFRIFDRQHPIKLPLFVNAVSVEPGLQQSAILPFANGIKSELRVDLAQGQQFTHIEIQFSLSTNDLLADFSKIQDLQDTILLEGLATGTVVLPPLISRVPKLSMIFDHVYGRYWRTTDSDPLQDARGNIYGHECNVFPLKSFELGTLLPHDIHALPRASNVIHRLL